jgi:Ca2+-binding RTX toxin-like protein
LAGDDTLTGNGGDDVLVGGSGVDLFFGGAGDDTYYIDEAGDLEADASGEGFDTVYSSVDHILNGEIERLILTGDAPIYGTGTTLDNSIFGNGAANVVYGYDGNDTLHGGGAADQRRRRR